jgi:hypothetical protein
MNGLTVRWSLVGAPADTLERLAAYVGSTSHARFSTMPELAYKTWRAVPGEWFEGCYVFGSDAERAAFQAEFEAGADTAPGSQIVGAPPVLVEACEIVAIAEGGAGFSPLRPA